jgi:hypothetical protein
VTKIDDVIADLRKKPRRPDDCNGVAGQTGIHDAAISEIERLQRALEIARDNFSHLESLLPTGLNRLRKLAEAGEGNAQKTLDYSPPAPPPDP